MSLIHHLMRFSVLGACVLGACASTGTPEDGKEAAAWTAPASTVIYPRENTALNAWEAFKSRSPVPSVDQHLKDPILDGAIDIHAHFGPDSYSRQWDAFEIAKLAQARGMRGIVFKNHWSESAGLAWLIRKYAAPNLEVFGSLSLNAPEGGVNPQAVRYFAEVEGGYGKVVWMPTHDSEHEVRFQNAARPYVRVSENGALLPEVLEVLDLIAEYDLTLATGHVSPEEMLAIMSEAKKRGIDKIIVTHPNLGPMFTDPSIDQLKQAVSLGGYVEIVSGQLRRDGKEGFMSMIRTLGPEHCIVSTDSGLVGTPNHADALILAAQELRKFGFTESELDLMFKKNPAAVLGLAAN